MTRAEAETALDWAAAEGWNPGLNDAGVFHAADPEGFLLAEREGEPLGCISAVAYGPGFGFLGLYIVRPPARGQGVGGRLFRAGVERLGGRVIGLDGVVAQKESYRRFGFRLAFTSLRRAARGGGEDPGGCRELGPGDGKAVAALDRACFPAPRSGFLEAWLSQPGATALGAPGAGGLAGYGVMRPCRQGCKIGPLFALEPAAGRRLLLALLSRAPAGAEVFWDTPLNNPHAVALARELGLDTVFETARMYLHGQPEWHPERVFGVTTFELG
jgi:GNAT superfamily N-acetyltransferase